MCPVCRERMIAYELDGVEIDRCPACGGTWLDAGELQMLTERAGVDVGELSHALERSRDGRRVRRRCPRCAATLREIHAGREQRAVLDRCPRGDGLWFDRGELLAVVRSYADDEEREVARFFTELYRSELESETGEPS